MQSVARDFAISDEPCALADLARRWRVSIHCLRRLCDKHDIVPDYVASVTGLYEAVRQEELARALEAKRRYRWRRSAASVRPAAG